MRGLFSLPLRLILATWEFLTSDECLKPGCTNRTEPGFTICYDCLNRVAQEARYAAVRGGRI